MVGGGFVLISCAALLSTGSAINATMYGTSRLSYIIAREGELPELLKKKVWHRPVEGLIITSLITIIIANFFDLLSISTVGSAGFLIIFAAVNGANLKLYRLTNSKRLIPDLGLVACIGAQVILIWQTAISSPVRLMVLIIMALLAFVVEWLYRRLSGRRMNISEPK